ncbi:MAG TPA: TlyA family RNA methyltransferase [Candidatus Binataceae bacterium]|jgi:23S rRNA (cytidine1920-2'-O)/16S rRNA (cytidine1409-2'-O)-methyltransferase|nr:TlyA family RNA methyltransferase [Candidatus Binataceae bacterium]
MAKRRLDLELVRRGLAPSRESAQRLIMAGRVRVDSRPALKADLGVGEHNSIELVGGATEYASRGGLKLAAALDHFGIDPAGRRALDVGASTGGFTDVLLRRGAAHVVALDVGYGQIAERLRRHARVTVLDRTNIRFVKPGNLPYAPELVTIDVSFISLRLVLPAVLALSVPEVEIVALIKPQFEVGKGMVGKGGVVRDDALRIEAVVRIVEFAQGLGLEVLGTIESPVRGAAGNLEYLAAMRRRANSHQ